MFRSVALLEQGHIDAVVIACFAGRSISAAEDPAVQEAAGRPEFLAEPGQVVEAFPANSPRVFIVGLGERDAVSLAVLRKAFASVIRRIAAAKTVHVQARIDGLSDMLSAGRIFGEAAGMLGWQPGFLRSKEDDKLADLRLAASDETFARGMRHGLKLAEAVNFSRQLAQTPPNIATPAWMAAQAEALASETGLQCRVMRGEELERERMTGLLNVGRASENPPCLIRLEWRPEGSRDKPVVLLGKTITYDTGGLSIKGKTSMPGMKGDKAGGCAVLGAMKAVAELIQPDFPVVALLVAAENSIHGNAYRPDDVIVYRNGLSVEVTNTDAEGRLVLADGLCWAADRENPLAIIDLATLTGGVVTALGDEYCGYFSSSSMLASDLEEAAAVSGDKIWRLPLDEAYKEMMKSPVADLVNSNLNGKAHPVQGATFLWSFVPAGLPWAHLDIAGTAHASKDAGLYQAGPTGFGVRLLADLLRGPLSLA